MLAGFLARIRDLLPRYLCSVVMETTRQWKGAYEIKFLQPNEVYYLRLGLSTNELMPPIEIGHSVFKRLRPMIPTQPSPAVILLHSYISLYAPELLVF